MGRYTYLLDTSDLFQMDLNLDDHTIDIVSKTALAQAKKLEKLLFPESFPDTPAPYCDAYYKVKASAVWKLRRELDLV